MARLELKKVFEQSAALADQTVTVCGWAKTIRDSKALGFIELNDGSCFNNLQVVFEDSKVANFKEIAKAKKSVSIPVVANGGVFSNADAQTLLDKTGADGVMVARSALFNPQIFCELTGTPKEKKFVMLQKQLRWTSELFDERFTTVFMRKMASFYAKGERGASTFKDKIFQAQTPEEILTLAKAMWQ